MSFRLPFGATVIVAGLALWGGPVAAVMQTVRIPDPSASTSILPPDGLFDKSIPDSWQDKRDSAQQTGGGFHFTVSGASGGYSSTSNPSALDDAKRPGSEFYQPLPGTAYPTFGH